MLQRVAGGSLELAAERTEEVDVGVDAYAGLADGDAAALGRDAGGSATWVRVVIPAAIGPGARASRTHVVLGVRLAAPQEADRQRQDARQAA
jgi:hypothetical protein